MNSDHPHVVAVCGSQRDGSFTHVALTHALEAAERAGATTDLIDLAALELPLFDPADSDAGDAAELRDRLARADAIILGTPMYHGSYSSVLKTAIDYCGSDEFEAKTVGLLAVAGGAFPGAALDHLRIVVRSLGGWVLPHQAAVPRADDAIDGGTFVDQGLAERIATLGRHAVGFAGIEPVSTADPCHDAVATVN